VTKQILVAEFLRAQAAWRLARADGAPVRAARCAAALLDAAAYAAALREDDEDLAALARGGCFRGSVFDPGARGITIARSWQFGDPPHAGPRDLLTTLAVVAGRRVGVLGCVPWILVDAGADPRRRRSTGHTLAPC
jgi:hypothetical protein